MHMQWISTSNYQWNPVRIMTAAPIDTISENLVAAMLRSSAMCGISSTDLLVC